jgi:hypothetical protein
MPLGSPIVVPHRLAILAFLFFDVLPEAGKITRNLPLLLGQASLMATDLLVQLRLLSAQTTMLFLKPWRADSCWLCRFGRSGSVRQSLG